MSNFDDILKAGKEKVCDLNITPQEWRRRIKALMNALNTLNEFYGDDIEDHVDIETINCGVCEKISYIIEADNFKNTSQKIKFFQSGWAKNQDKYLCDKCK